MLSLCNYRLVSEVGPLRDVFMLKLFSTFFSILLVAACSKPLPTYKAAGHFDNVAYIVELTNTRGSAYGTTVISINNREVFKHTLENMQSDDACSKVSTANWKCTFNTVYNEKRLTLVSENITSTIPNQIVWKIFLEGKLLTQINVI